MEKDKKANETEQDKIRKNNNDNKKQISNHKLKTDRVCWKWVNFKCWKGENCTYDHPEMCNADIDKEQCRKNPCNLYQSQVCKANLSHKVCR